MPNMNELEDNKSVAEKINETPVVKSADKIKNATETTTVIDLEDNDMIVEKNISQDNTEAIKIAEAVNSTVDLTSEISKLAAQNELIITAINKLVDTIKPATHDLIPETTLDRYERQLAAYIRS